MYDEIERRVSAGKLLALIDRAGVITIFTDDGEDVARHVLAYIFNHLSSGRYVLDSCSSYGGYKIRNR